MTCSCFTTVEYPVEHILSLMICYNSGCSSTMAEECCLTPQKRQDREKKRLILFFLSCRVLGVGPGGDRP